MFTLGRVKKSLRVVAKVENIPTWTCVVALALRDGKGRWLMHRRPADKHHGGLWEFPGGKVETGETPRNALVREIEEELGLRGAGTLAEKVQPDAAIAVDTVPAGGTPEYDFHAFPIVIGRGPVIKFSENGRVTNHPRMRQLLQFAAEKTNTPHQLAAAPPGGTDMQPIEQSGTGVPAAAIGIPRRYAHSPNEVVDLRDVQGAIEILTESITLFDSGYSLDRI